MLLCIITEILLTFLKIENICNADHVMLLELWRPAPATLKSELDTLGMKSAFSRGCSDQIVGGYTQGLPVLSLLFCGRALWLLGGPRQCSLHNLYLSIRLAK